VVVTPRRRESRSSGFSLIPVFTGMTEKGCCLASYETIKIRRRILVVRLTAGRWTVSLPLDGRKRPSTPP